MDLIPRLRTELARGTPESLADATSRAAVAVVLRNGGRAPFAGESGTPTTEVLLIRRQERPADPWSGHMAFPGGRHDPSDVDLRRTAERETLEEVGLDLRRVAEPIGRLRDVPAYARGKHTGMAVSPFVFHLLEDAPLVLDSREVRETVWAPVGPLIAGRCDTVFEYTPAPQANPADRREMPAFDVEGRVVWGLTYFMLRSLFDAAGTNTAAAGGEPKRG